MPSVSEIPAPWLIALDLAWAAMVSGTTPVGAVVVDDKGMVVTSGRGRRYVQESASRQLSFSHLAHAELNALAQLDPNRRYADHTVLTTLEPCLLCVGAAVMATVGRVEYAGADPYGGAAHLEFKNPHTLRLMPAILGPADGMLGAVGALLHYAFYRERDASGAVVIAYKEQMSEFIREMDASGLTDRVLHLKAEKAELRAVLELLDRQ